MTQRRLDLPVSAFFALAALSMAACTPEPAPMGSVTVEHAAVHDVSLPLNSAEYAAIDETAGEVEGEATWERPPNALAPDEEESEAEREEAERGMTAPTFPPLPAAAVEVEQRTHGTKPAARMVASFDGLGVGFVGPQGTVRLNNPSDNTLAVGPNHIVQIVNGAMAIYTKKGKLYDTTGKVLYGPVHSRNVWKGFGGECDTRGSGDAVVRYDQLADRWLVVVPLFSRSPQRTVEPPTPKGGEPPVRSMAGQSGQPGKPVILDQPPPPPPPPPADSSAGRGRGRGTGTQQPRNTGSYGMCYAVSTGSDPFGPYYRYEFVRPLFPDYPRPAVWPDGYYVPTSTGDGVIEKHACVADRNKMLNGEDATEQCIVIPDVNFINTADLDGKNLPPKGAPNIMIAGGGSQLKKVLADSSLYAWSFHVDWDDPTKTKIEGPTRIAVAPYQYLCGGQLTQCVPQPDDTMRLDAQGDKIMARLVYRRIGNDESVVAVHSVNTSAGAGGVRWYEFRVNKDRSLTLYQQGTYAPDSSYRWLPSPAIDKFGNIGIGYSFGGTPFPAGQRFAAREPKDPKGMLTMHEAIMVNGEGSQRANRWEDYSQTAIDPDDDCTVWYVGDYVKKGATTYTSRIGSFKMPGCR